MKKVSAKKRISAEALEYFREMGRIGGKKGAQARMDKVSPEDRSRIARKAVAARIAKYGQKTHDSAK